MWGSSSGGMPVPVSSTVSTAWVAGGLQRHGDGAVQGEFQGVGDQIENDLFPHLAVDVNRFVKGGALDFEVQPGAFHGGAEVGGEILGEAAELGGLKDGLHAAGLDAREIEQCVD